jgi:hypothetical protein
MTDWNKIAQDAKQDTDEQLKDQLSNLTKLDNKDIEAIIMETGISQTDLTSVLKEVKDATKSNEDKANAIKNIDKGITALVGIASKIL